jgi:hypothetical protein
LPLADASRIKGKNQEGDMEVHVTDRGLQRIQFTDDYGNPGILEQAPGIDYGNPAHDVPNSSFVLLGHRDAPLQLNLEQVGALVEYLQAWLEHGQFKPGAGRGFRVDAGAADEQRDHLQVRADVAKRRA